VLGQRPEGAGRYDPLDYRLEVRTVDGGDRTAEVPLGRLEPRFMLYLPDGQHLLFATGDWQFPNEVHVVDPADESSMITLEDVREVDALRIAPDGEHLAIRDGPRVRVWNVTTGRAVAQLPTDAFIAAIGFSPDGEYLATASHDDDLTLWSWRTEGLIDRACHHLTRNLTRAEWRDFLPDTPYRATCPNLPSDPVEQQNPA
jgi:WD40 repeat protein